MGKLARLLAALALAGSGAPALAQGFDPLNPSAAPPATARPAARAGPAPRGPTLPAAPKHRLQVGEIDPTARHGSGAAVWRNPSGGITRPADLAVFDQAPSAKLGDLEAERAVLCGTLYEGAAYLFQMQSSIGRMASSKRFADPGKAAANFERAGREAELDRSAAAAVLQAGRKAYGSSPAQAAEFDRATAATRKWVSNKINAEHDPLPTLMDDIGCPQLPAAAPFAAQSAQLFPSGRR